MIIGHVGLYFCFAAIFNKETQVTLLKNLKIEFYVTN